MRPPPFRLERVLRLRQRQLDHAKLELTATETALAQARGVTEIARHELRSATRAQQRRLETGLYAGEFHATVLAIDSAHNREKRASQRENACAAKSDAARNALLAARTQVRALEGLRDRRARDERSWQQRLEQSELDEIGSRTVAGRKAFC